MRVIDLENINYAMRNETQFVLRCEEVFHDKISAAAAAILSNRQEKPVVALTGPSGSGKTTTAMRLQEYLQNLGVKVCLLSMDNFFLPLDQRPPEPLGPVRQTMGFWLLFIKMLAAAELILSWKTSSQRRTKRVSSFMLVTMFSMSITRMA